MNVAISLSMNVLVSMYELSTLHSFVLCKSNKNSMTLRAYLCLGMQDSQSAAE